MLNTKTGKIVLGGFIALVVLLIMQMITIATFVMAVIYLLIEIARRDTNRKIEDASRNPKVTLKPNHVHDRLVR